MPEGEKKIIALVDVDETTFATIKSCNFANIGIMRFNSGLDLCTNWGKSKLDIIAIISQSEVIAPNGLPLLETIKSKGFPNVPFILLSNNINENIIKLCIREGVADIFRQPVRKEQLITRIDFLAEHWEMITGKDALNKLTPYKTPILKRIFDIVFSGIALICLLPFFLIITIIMKIESNGPVFYYSKRVGTGYRIFKFYKFRSMYMNADKKLKELKHLNQYDNADTGIEAKTDTNILCDDCIKNGTKCQYVLYADDNSWCEKNYINSRKALKGAAFFKLKNDPRITRIGKILRNTSIDELPQLWNVFIGDMSIVGNRPLPLYEAEKLTTDKYAMRFRAPAGITGLWQVEKRGKGDMSEEERMMLDNAYAQNHSFKNDIIIILRTIPALFQKENV